MAFKRKFAGAGYRAAPRKRYTSAPRTSKPPPKALRVKGRRRNYRASYKLSRPFKQVLTKFLDKDKQTHWVTMPIMDQGTPPIPYKDISGQYSGIFQIFPKIFQVGASAGGPAIQQDNISSREGSTIKAKSFGLNLSIRLNSFFNPDNHGLTHVRYKIMLLSCKKFSQWNDIENNFFDSTQGEHMEASMFLRGAQPVHWDAKMENFDDPINTAIFTVHDTKTGVLNRGLSYGDINGSAVQIPSAVHNVRLNVKCKSKILRFDDPGHARPSNFCPFLWIGWKTYDGTDWSGAQSEDIVRIVGNLKFSFDDMC